MTGKLLDEIGFDSEAELRDAIRANIRRQFEYRQRKWAREQIARALTASAQLELPPDLLRRQAQRELDRAVLELQRSGFSAAEIQAQANELRQNSLAVTAMALKEHFIFERIAEEEGIEVTEEDYVHEINLIAEQIGDSPRRIRARLEKNDRMDVLRNQIIERKVVDLILAHAQFRDVPWEPSSPEAEAIDRAVGGDLEEELAEANPEAQTDQQS